MSKVWIYSGVPGSGKTTLSKQRHPSTLATHRPRGSVSARRFSADDYFTDDHGTYRFDPSKLPEAHAYCLREFTGYVSHWVINRPCDLVVDNTNTTAVEIAPYAALALAYGWDLEIVTVQCDPEVAAARNTHGVPLAAVQAMAKRLSERQLPPWWPTSTVNAST